LVVVISIASSVRSWLEGRYFALHTNARGCSTSNLLRPQIRNCARPSSCCFSTVVVSMCL
jgi:hypothetical protein